MNNNKCINVKTCKFVCFNNNEPLKALNTLFTPSFTSLLHTEIPIDQLFLAF